MRAADCNILSESHEGDFRQPEAVLWRRLFFAENRGFWLLFGCFYNFHKFPLPGLPFM